MKNKTLTTLATKLGLAGHMLVGGEEGRMTPPLLHTHAATDCFEAVLGAVCLDGGLPQVQKMFARLVFPEQVRDSASIPAHLRGCQIPNLPIASCEVHPTSVS